MIIFRYLAKEVYQTCLAISGILLFVIICNQMIVYLTNAAAGNLPVFVVFKLILIQIPLFLTILLPLGFFLSILLAYGRMYVESEMIALGACGFGNIRLVISTLLLSIFIVLIVTYLAFISDPKVTAYQYQLQAKMGLTTVVQTLMPGRFRALDGDKYVIYVGGMSRDRKTMSDIFIANRHNTHQASADQAQDFNVLTAKSGDFYIDPKNGAEFIVCHDGYYYSGTPGTKNYQIVKFTQVAYWLQNKITSISTKAAAVSTSTLVKNLKNNANYQAELQKRISMPLMIPIVTLLAIPLSRVRPRQGKFARIVPAILLYILYANTILVAQKWVQNGQIPLTLGLWWIHAGMLLIAAWFLIDLYGWPKAIDKLYFWRKSFSRHPGIEEI